MKREIDYRKLESNEDEQYHKLRLECLQQHPNNFGTLFEEEKDSTNFKFDKIITDKNSTDFLAGAFNDKELIGICGFIQEKRQKTRHIGEISGMYVKQEFSGQSIGSSLLQFVIKRAFENSFLEQIILAVADKNGNAQNLYLKHNFKIYGRLENYFKHKGEYETQVFMVLTKDSL
jgi:ribosomal protein S18 acetylase RimI-like enzyme